MFHKISKALPAVVLSIGVLSVAAFAQTAKSLETIIAWVNSDIMLVRFRWSRTALEASRPGCG